LSGIHLNNLVLQLFPFQVQVLYFLRLEDDFDAIVLLVTKGLVGSRSVIERDPVRDNEGRINFIPLNTRKYSA